MGVKLDTVTARRRIYALGENAFAIVGKYLHTGAVNEHTQLDSRVLLELGTVTSGEVFGERNLPRASAINVDLAAEGVEPYQSFGVLVLPQPKSNVFGLPGAKLGLELVNFCLHPALKDRSVNFLHTGIHDAELLPPEPFKLPDWSLHQPQPIGIAAQHQRAWNGLCSPPEHGRFGIRILPVAEPADPHAPVA